MRAATSWPLIGDTRDVARWSGSLFLVLAIYAAVVAVLLTWKVPIQPLSLPPAVVMLDLQPIPPPPVITPPAPPEPIKPPEPEIKVEEPAVVLPIPKPRPPLRKPVEPQPEPPRLAPPVEAPPVAAPPVAAPVMAAPVVAPPDPMSLFKARLMAHVERYKRYPRTSQIRHEQGTVLLRFTMDRHGRVLAARIERGSGYRALDDEMMAMIHRAEPLPSFPDDLPQAEQEMLMPMNFFLR